jgi:hypothetical protein
MKNSRNYAIEMYAEVREQVGMIVVCWSLRGDENRMLLPHWKK